MLTFDGSFYQNLREMSLFILDVHEDDFESPPCILIACVEFIYAIAKVLLIFVLPAMYVKK